jgi:ABC-2 type transport system ATP-binding protein
MIEVKNLTRFYGNASGVEDVSFTVKRGAIAGLLGPNGAGKSTIMKLLTGYLAPDAGTVLIDGTDIAREPRNAAAKIGYAPEIPPLYGDMTTESYLNFVADLKGVKKSERAEHLEKVMEMASVKNMRGRLLKNLSKGYRQRAGVAQALVGFPPVLILDEPTAGLDPGQIAGMRHLLRSLAGRHTVILSSHILSEISEVCEQIIIISGGKVVANQSAKEIEGDANTWQITIKLEGKNTPDAVMEKIKTMPGVVKAEISAERKTLEQAFLKATAGTRGENEYCCPVFLCAFVPL